MEKIMHYIWQHRLWPRRKMTTVDGRELQVLDQGRLNRDAGPDFFNAKIKIDGQLWVGDVEIHVKASDWYRHRHDKDKAYNSVILHVVDKDDAMVCTPATGKPIAQFMLRCNPAFPDCYRALTAGASTDLPCTSAIASLDRIHATDWLTSLAYERVIDKSERVFGILEATVNNWEEVCYVVLARALGTGTNGDAFQRLALSAPLRILGKHADNLLAVESILFGQAGLLEGEMPDNDYFTRLKREYEFMRSKFGLVAPADLNWKMARMRPANFPHRRIALLASFVASGFGIMNALLGCRNPEQAREVLTRSLTGYWLNHFNFSSLSGSSSGQLNRSTVDSLVINVAVPLLYAFGIKHPSVSEGEELQQRAFSFLEQLKPEKNFITVMFNNAGLECTDAFTSQALIQLRRSYCENHKCIYCRFGHRMLASKALAEELD